LPNNIYNWILSFLTGRQQKCIVNGVCSQLYNITRGIIQGSVLGPTLCIITKNDLKTLSAINLINKYADDVDLLVPEHTDVDIVGEFEHIKNWTNENKMILNMSKTKEIVFRRRCPVRFHLSPSFDSIEMVDHIKSLGVIIQQKLNVELHMSSLLKQCSQRMYSLKLVPNQGLSANDLHTVFHALSPAYFMHYRLGECSSVMDSLVGLMPFSSAPTNGFSNKLITVTELLTQSFTTLFMKIKYNPSHRLSTLLPPKKSVNYSLRNCDFNYELPQCTYTNHKQSFINHCLFNM